MSGSYGPSDRFNEERATYAVRGSDVPDLETGVAAIRNVLATLPTRSGVYRMQDAKGGHDGGGSSGHDGGGSSGNPSKPRKVIPIYEA